ncbi:MAG: hypothetical protein ACI8P3_001023 [Saprospiraceae bacterium]|jgi:hypothetical protein
MAFVIKVVEKDKIKTIFINNYLSVSSFSLRLKN